MTILGPQDVARKSSVTVDGVAIDHVRTVDTIFGIVAAYKTDINGAFVTTKDGGDLEMETHQGEVTITIPKVR